MPAITSGFSAIAGTARDQGWTYEALLAAVLAARTTDREAAVIQARTRAAWCPQIKTLGVWALTTSRPYAGALCRIRPGAPTSAKPASRPARPAGSRQYPPGHCPRAEGELHAVRLRRHEPVLPASGAPLRTGSILVIRRPVLQEHAETSLTTRRSRFAPSARPRPAATRSSPLRVRPRIGCPPSRCIRGGRVEPHARSETTCRGRSVVPDPSLDIAADGTGTATS